MNKWIVEDGRGTVHTIELDKNGVWWGLENVAMGSELANRNLIKQGLVRMFETMQQQGTYGDYTWIKIPVAGQ